MDALTLDISPEVWGMIGLAVIAIVKLIDELFNKNWRGASKIVGAALAGTAIAALVPDVKLFVGALAGLSASGLITTAGFLSSKPVAAASGTGDVNVLPDGEVVA